MYQIMTARIDLLEDELAIAQTLQFAFQREGWQVRHYSLGRDLLNAWQQQQTADLVVLDVGLPDLSGFEVCRQLRKFSEVPVLFLSARSEEVDRIVGLEIGADDYISKPFSVREVVARVQANLRRQSVNKQQLAATPSAQAQTDTAWFSHNPEQMSIHFRGQVLVLTRYEYLLLQTMLARPAAVFSRQQLMELVWHDALETSDRTVDTHIKSLRAKLRLIDDQLDPIKTLRGLGYSLVLK